ncbi:ArsR/SmtB family transcription factor [Amnibacterium kyonggiense]|uniref:ArsR family transcriptional regulator n=1 Tax=Amnibacterium kyonggiense TaxID=595671 RepID=A0A4R7FRZ5_9MICO|nr:metalloregulator ArsR/SmtB family transcription factor [Amnibacterium kyonggiense]TDS80615.1 ArsR family transcriptional regulator [Amnibacterium kyonggiense]
MHAFEVLGDPVRRRIVELLANGERTAGDVVDAVGAEFGITQPAVSRHLRILRESGFATVRPEGARRLYALQRAGFDEADAVLQRYRRLWPQRLDALRTEIARGARAGKESS